MVNHQEKTPLGIRCFGFFSKHLMHIQDMFDGQDKESLANCFC